MILYNLVVVPMNNLQEQLTKEHEELRQSQLECFCNYIELEQSLSEVEWKPSEEACQMYQQAKSKERKKREQSKEGQSPRKEEEENDLTVLEKKVMSSNWLAKGIKGMKKNWNVMRN